MLRLGSSPLNLILRPLADEPLTTLRLWRRRLANRHVLSRLDSEQMRDAGLDPTVVRQEVQKWFWEA